MQYIGMDTLTLCLRWKATSAEMFTLLHSSTL